jgi:nitroreductase / dihydropteridine reductase
MEGYIANQVDDLLGLPEKNLRSVALLALGYRDAENDMMSKSPKFRWSKEKLFTTI